MYTRLLIILTLGIPYVQCDLEIQPKRFTPRCSKDLDIQQREDRCEVVFNGRIVSKTDPHSGIYNCTVSLYRVLKGEDVLSDALQIPPAEYRRFYQKEVNVTGFGNPAICDNEVTLGDIRVFMVNLDGSSAMLNSSLIRLGLRTLKRSKLIAQDDQSVKNIVSECKFFFCSFYAECKLGYWTQQPYCECPSCDDEPQNQVICGSDGNWYTNKCSIRKESCIRRKRIYKTLSFKCRAAGPPPTIRTPIEKTTEGTTAKPAITKPAITKPAITKPAITKPAITKPAKSATTPEQTATAPKQTTTTPATTTTQGPTTTAVNRTINPSTGEVDPCENKNCQYMAVCRRAIDGKSARCECPQICPSFGDSDQDEAVCGSDGRSYETECELRKYACTNMIPITIKHRGKCDPCLGFRCADQKSCIIEANNKPYCGCVNNCTTLDAPVCGTDNKIYDNECFLKFAACKTNDTRLDVAYTGICKFVNNPCDQVLCTNGASCRVSESGLASCRCHDNCPVTQSLACGSNGKTYRNLCHLEREACNEAKNITVVAYEPCSENACLNFKCDFDALCELVVIDETQPAMPNCVCPSCPDILQPVCGDNGVTYDTECHLRTENCHKRSSVKITHRGVCSQCASTHCEFGNCQNINGTRFCLCPEACVDANTPVCGDDGVTYNNMCQLTVQSCKVQRKIEKVKDEPCDGDSCLREKSCLFQGVCKGNSCLCDWVCPDTLIRVCGSDGVTYLTKCHLEKTMCEQQKFIVVSSEGACDEKMDGNASGDNEGGEDGSGGAIFPPDMITSTGAPDDYCNTQTNCKFGGECDFTSDKMKGDCKCMFDHCQNDSPVCASNGKVYTNICKLRERSCLIQQDLDPREDDYCIRNGHSTSQLLCYDNSLPISGYNCSDCLPSNVGDCSLCPTNHYCNKGACCVKDDSVPDCTYTEFGCCPEPDETTRSPGRDNRGCPSENSTDTCQCNKIGSNSQLCDPKTFQCDCKPGVGGTACNKCQPGFYGHQHMVTASNAGCLPCLCHKYGSVRRDCEQELGRCQCKPRVTGMKCELCADKDEILTEDGCVLRQITETCDTKQCLFDSRCVMNSQKKPECRCDYTCPDTISYVCGSDSRTYNNSCILKKANCLQAGSLTQLYAFSCESLQTTTFTTTTEEDGGWGNWIWGSNLRADAPQVKRENKPLVTSLVTCADNPCMNKAMCIEDRVRGYSCKCSAFYTGRKCQESVLFEAPHFNKESFLKVVGWSDKEREFDLRLSFIPLSLDGILLFAGSLKSKGDFVSLVLNDGILQFRFNNGGGSAVIESPEKLLSNRRYDVQLKKRETEGTLHIEGMNTVTGYSMGEKTTLNIDSSIYLGGINTNEVDFPGGIDRLYKKYFDGVHQGFMGCITKLHDAQNNQDFKLRSQQGSMIVAGKNIGECTADPCLNKKPCENGGVCEMIDTYNFLCNCVHPYTGQRCTERKISTRHLSSQSDVQPTARYTGSSYSVYRTKLYQPDSFNITVIFNSRHHEGVLAFISQYTNGSGDFLMLMIDDGFIRVKYDVGNGLREIRLHTAVTLHDWHMVTYRRRDDLNYLSVDGRQPAISSTKGDLTQLNLDERVYIGGLSTQISHSKSYLHTHGFHGYIQRVEVNGVDVGDLFSSAVEMFRVKVYKGPPCRPNPCPNYHTCIPLMEDYVCESFRKGGV